MSKIAQMTQNFGTIEELFKGYKEFSGHFQPIVKKMASKLSSQIIY